MGIAEISHRSKAFEQVLKDANADLRSLLEIPDNYRVLWMQGGGLTQFAATALNLAAAYRIRHQLKPEDDVEAEYVVTGSWSAKAFEEGTRMGLKTTKIVDGKKIGGGKFSGIPNVAGWDLKPHDGTTATRKPAFVYYCDNETVDGVEFAIEGEAAFPFDKFDKDVPIVCDMSSNFLSRPVDVAKYGIIYAGAQKNLGPSGVTVVIAREDLIGQPEPRRAHFHPVLTFVSQSTSTPRFPLEELAFPACSATRTWPPTIPCTSTSLSPPTPAPSPCALLTSPPHSTPPTFTIYVCSLVLRSLLASPPLPLSSPGARPLSPLAAYALAKSSLIYELLDGSSKFYVGTANENSRSRMNVTFRLQGEGKEREEREKRFIALAGVKGIQGVGGHRSVGGNKTFRPRTCRLKESGNFLLGLLVQVFARLFTTLSRSSRSNSWSNS
jgi:phosphoserine aminotransferase